MASNGNVTCCSYHPVVNRVLHSELGKDNPVTVMGWGTRGSRLSGHLAAKPRPLADIRPSGQFGARGRDDGKGMLKVNF